MYVNPFWFGVLVGILSVLVLAVVVSAISRRCEDADDEDIEDK